MRKRFCTSFDFELQAAANDDAIVLSLGPQHSFPLTDVPGFLRAGKVREALTNAVIVTPMFGARWRWNLNRSLVVLRFRGGKKNPPQLQRMEADDVMVAVFPALAACQDNATGPREIPDHVLVRQTLDDCMNEAMDVTALEALLAQIATGEVELHYRESTEPSLLAHEILSSRPYTFLDDAPLEERRTRAVQLRRGVPLLTRELAALDPSAIERVRAEAVPQPRDRDELHDWLLWLGVMQPQAAWQAWFDQLAAEQRVLTIEQAQPAVASSNEARDSSTNPHPGDLRLWCAVERREQMAPLFPNAKFEPDWTLEGAAPALDIESSAAFVVRGHLETQGPTTVPRLMAATGLSEDTVVAALAQLESQGFALRGAWEAPIQVASEPRGVADELPRGTPGERPRGTATEQWCARRLLGRIHAYTQARLRREIEPVSAQDLMRFLLRFQHVHPGTQLSGSRGVLAVIEQLQGCELAVAGWERDILASRVESYRPEWLDALCLSGQVTWGRLQLRAPRLSGARALPNRATPLSLVTRADLNWLLEAARGPVELGTVDVEAPLPEGDAGQIIAALRQHGALFFSQLASCTGMPEPRVREALWEAVALGWVTADGWQALRSLLVPRAAQRGMNVPDRRRGLRRGARGAIANEGRWALLPQGAAAVSGADADELAEAVAEQLLARYGVVFRDLLVRESLALPWRDIVWALRRLEARGTVRGGRFVNGFVGEQYALPEAVDLLRQVRRKPHDGEVVRLSGCDPLNLVGILLPGPRIPALQTNQLCLRDGLLVSEETKLLAETAG
jgi:ATP-dependent Lhr-like helicase